MFKRLLYIFCCLVLLFSACRSSRKAQIAYDAKEDALFNAWINHPRSELIRVLGTPDSIAPDGKGGQILIYKEKVDYKSVMNSNYTGTQYSFRKEMYVTRDSIIYSWRARRRK